MTTKQASELEKLAKEDMKERTMTLAKELGSARDVSYERWLAREQKEARIIEENL